MKRLIFFIIITIITFPIFVSGDVIINKKAIIGKYYLSSNSDSKKIYIFKNDSDIPYLLLKDNNTFNLYVNYCEGFYTAEGIYNIKDNTNIIEIKFNKLIYKTHVEYLKKYHHYKFVILSENKLLYKENCIGCFICKNDILIKK